MNQKNPYIQQTNPTITNLNSLNSESYPNIQTTKSFRHFAKHLFIIGRVYMQRKKARQDIDGQLDRMKKSIFRMSLGPKDIDRLKEKLSNLIDLERKYAKLFRPKDNESLQLQSHINALEDELRKEREDKQRIIDENSEKIRLLMESLANIREQIKHLHLERAKRHQRIKVLENKINEKVDIKGYFN